MASGRGGAQGHDLGMGATGLLGVATADDRAITAGQHAAHTGVRFGQADGLGSQLQCLAHAALVLVEVHDDCPVVSEAARQRSGMYCGIGYFS